jgi:transcriptional regulator with XRE-family HTH domain
MDITSMKRIRQQQNFGPAVRAIRARLGLNQADFGARIGCNQNTISRYEAGYFPSNEALMAVWNLANKVEQNLLRAYIAELFEFIEPEEQKQAINSIRAKKMAEGLADPAIVARFEYLYRQHLTDPDATWLFHRAADWLETEFQMRAAKRNQTRENDAAKD